MLAQPYHYSFGRFSLSSKFDRSLKLRMDGKSDIISGTFSLLASVVVTKGNQA